MNNIDFASYADNAREQDDNQMLKNSFNGLLLTFSLIYLSLTSNVQ